MSIEIKEAPKSVDDVIADLKGFGLEENEEILTFTASGKIVKLRISNIPTEEEMKALLAVEDLKGYAWVQRIRCEILSRAITWANGVNIKELTPEQRIVTDPTTKSKCDIQVALRNILLGWGQEVLQTLWKILMVHSDKIEKRLLSNFPETATTTELERRFFDAALKEIRESNQEVIEDVVTKTLEEQLAKEQAEKKA